MGLSLLPHGTPRWMEAQVSEIDEHRAALADLVAAVGYDREDLLDEAVDRASKLLAAPRPSEAATLSNSAASAPAPREAGMGERRTTLDVLIAARARIAAPEYWTPHGRELGGRQPPYCMATACAVAADSRLALIAAIAALEAQTGAMGLIRFNTHCGHAAVLDAFDRAIAKATGNA